MSGTNVRPRPGSRTERWRGISLIGKDLSGCAPLVSLARLISFASIGAVVLLLSACSPPAQSKQFRVVTTFTVIQDIVKNIAGDAAIVHSITKPGADIHNYLPTPRDIVKAQKADLVIWNGLGLERWFKKFFGNVANVPSAVISDGIKPISIVAGPYIDKPNPHAWMSATNALIYVENIRRALVKHNPENAATYTKNAAAYSAKIRALDRKLRAKLRALRSPKRKSRHWLVTSEGAFSYLARDYNLREAYIWPINADAQGTPQQVRRLIDLMRREAIGVIFSESTISDKPARQVAKETRAHYGGILYVDSLSKPDGRVPTYLKLLDVTVSTITQGLARGNAS